MGALERNNVHVIGSGSSTLVFAHGFGCDQTAEAITEFVRGFET